MLSFSLSFAQIGILLFLAVVSSLSFEVDGRHEQPQLLRRSLGNNATIDEEYRQIGESCNVDDDDTSSGCAPDLICQKKPALLGFMKKRDNGICFPMSCLEQAVKNFNDKVNMQQYQDMIFQKAGITPKEFFLLEEKDVKTGIIKDKTSRFTTSYSIAKNMLVSPKVHSVMQTIIDNPIPRDDWQDYTNQLAACDSQNILSQPKSNNSNKKGPTEPGILGTAGIGLDAGAVLGGGVEFFWSFPNSRPLPTFFIQLGGGIYAGVGAAVNPMIGMVFSGFQGDIPGFGFEINVQLPTPIVGPGTSI